MPGICAIMCWNFLSRTVQPLSPASCGPTRPNSHKPEYWIHGTNIIGHFWTIFEDVQWSIRFRINKHLVWHLEKPSCKTCFLLKTINRMQILPAIAEDFNRLTKWSSSDRTTVLVVSTWWCLCTPDNSGASLFIQHLWLTGYQLWLTSRMASLVTWSNSNGYFFPVGFWKLRCMLLNQLAYQIYTIL